MITGPYLGGALPGPGRVQVSPNRGRGKLTGDGSDKRDKRRRAPGALLWAPFSGLKQGKARLRDT